MSADKFQILQLTLDDLALVHAEAKIAAVAPEATAAARAVGLDDADDNHLADLLNRLVLKVPSDKTKP